MGAGFLQTPGPLNIDRLIKPGTQLNNSGDLFSGIGCFDECFDNGRITAGPIQRDFDRQNLWISLQPRSVQQFDRSCRKDDATAHPDVTNTSKNPHAAAGPDRAPVEMAGL
jgi:hypothetical protein